MASRERGGHERLLNERDKIRRGGKVGGERFEAGARLVERGGAVDGLADLGHEAAEQVARFIAKAVGNAVGLGRGRFRETEAARVGGRLKRRERRA